MNLDLPFRPPDSLDKPWREACGLRIPGTRAFLVGGPVRDHLLDRELRDLDFAVRGDSRAWTESLAHRLGGEVKVFPSFGTAKILWSGGEVDVAGLRRENYPEQGALPQTEPTTDLREDLLRRDFTLNAMAIPLREPSKLVDPFGGQEDLENRRLRILHPESFRDDPTRILRGFRFAGRLELSWEASTAQALGAQIRGEGFSHLSSFRLGREIKRILNEDAVSTIIQRLAQADLWESIHSSLRSPSFLQALPLLNREAELRRWWTELGGRSPEYSWLMRWAILLHLPQEPPPRWMGRIHLDSKEKAYWEELSGAAGRAQDPTEFSNLQWWRYFRRLSTDTLKFLAWVDPSFRPVVESWMRGVGALALHITGEDLIKAGLTPGPRMGAALQATLEERWRGTISADEEREYALKWYRNENSPNH